MAEIIAYKDCSIICFVLNSPFHKVLGSTEIHSHLLNIENLESTLIDLTNFSIEVVLKTIAWFLDDSPDGKILS